MLTAWGVELAGEHGTEWQELFVAEGTCSGRLEGRMTVDGADVLFDWRGYGRSYPVGRRQIVLAATHLADDDRYRWLNDVVVR